MELSEAVVEHFANFPDMSVTVTRVTSDSGREFSRININKQGTVYQFVERYPVEDENYIKNFIRRVEREL